MIEKSGLTVRDPSTTRPSRDNTTKATLVVVVVIVVEKPFLSTNQTRTRDHPFLASEASSLRHYRQKSRHSDCMRRLLIHHQQVATVLLLLLFLTRCQEYSLFAAAFSSNDSNNGRSSTSALKSTMASSSSFKTNLVDAQTLRTWVQQAAAHDEEQSSLDLKGIAWLEHVNLVVGSKPQAQEFYLDLLGCTADRSGSFHVNLGQQQFHLAETGDPAQKVTGSLGLVVPRLDTLRQRITAFQDKFVDSQFEVLHDTDNDHMTIKCPWGNRMHLYDLQAEQAALQPTSDSPHKMVNMHAQGGNYAAHRMAVRGQPGIRYIELACRPNTAAAIATFYREMMQCTVSEPTVGLAVVCVGPGVHIIYREDETLLDSDVQAMQGVHICIYVQDFLALYDRLQAKKLIWTKMEF